MISLLYAKDIPVNDRIAIHIPTVGEVLENEEAFWDIVHVITASPIDMIAQLDEVGIDFSKITSFDLFCLRFHSLQQMQTNILLGDLDLSAFQTAISSQNGEMMLYNARDEITIDKVIHHQIASLVRNILLLQDTNKKPANEEARLYLLQKAKRAYKRARNKKPKSQLEKYIIALVNTEQFSYDYNTINDISIYQFYMSLKQVIHKVNYDNIMNGYFSGTIKLDDIKRKDKTWIDAMDD